MSTLLKVFLTLIPISFIIQLLITEYLLYKRGIKVDGRAPINKNVFYISKYSVILVWAGMVLEIWDIHLIFNHPKIPIITYISYSLWILGFTLLYSGRFFLGNNFRIGIANERTEFIVGGVYKISRNPMYLGLFTTFIACMLYSFNLIYLIISVLIIIVHHLIILGEEIIMKKEYGEVYNKYCKKVRRYL